MTTQNSPDTCQTCDAQLPTRTVKITSRTCWKCHKRIKVATLHKGYEFILLDLITPDEAAYAKEHGIILEKRHSATVQRIYMANVCPKCDQMQGHHYLEQDDSMPEYATWVKQLDRKDFVGPCDSCAARHCETHGPYFDYTSETQCPECRREMESVPCPTDSTKRCFFTDDCRTRGCYFAFRKPV